MIDLAPALRPFISELALFDDEVCGGIGPWLLPLQRALGPMRVPHQATSGEPDGFAGLTRRGPYERLLASEWLLALEEPDEFMRRAVMNEHMFLAPQYREPGGVGTSVALFDTGPLQLGAPRLVQLALMIVLARRAAAARSEFRFGILQDQRAELRELDASGVQQWLSARTWLPAAHGLACWREALHELAPTDSWLVGAAATRAVADELCIHFVEVAEHDEAIEVHTHPRDRVGEVARLKLLAPDVAVRTLRQPLRPLTPILPRVTPSKANGIGRISLDGRRLMLTNPERTVHAIHLPGSTREHPGRVKHIGCRSPFIMLGADVYEGRGIALVAHDQELAIGGSGLVQVREGKRIDARTMRSLGTHVFTGIDVPASLRGDGWSELHVVEAGPTKLRAWIVDALAQLWELRLVVDAEGKLEESLLELRDRQCRNFTRLDREMICWVSLMLGTAITLPSPGEWELDDPELDTVLFSRCFGDPRASVAYARGKHWIVHHGQRRIELTRPHGQVIGIDWLPAKGLAPALLVVDADRRTVRRRTEETDDELLVAPGRIVAIRFEPATRMLLLGTEDQRLVYALDLRAVVWRSHTEVRG